MNKVVKVLDAPMGVGKTTGILNWMKDNPHKKFLYVTPLLSEAESRVPEDCPELGFVFPVKSHNMNKSEHLLKLLSEGKNVSFTHELFKGMKEEHLKYIKYHDYVLIIDEEVGMIVPFRGDVSRDDMKILRDAGSICVDYEDFGRVDWVGDYRDGRYDDIKSLSEMGMLYTNEANFNKDLFVLQLPINLIQSSNETILITYLFKGSILHQLLQMRGFTFEFINKCSNLEIPLLKTEEEILEVAREKIVLHDIDRSRGVGVGSSLSYSWYTNNAKEEELENLRKEILRCYRKSIGGSRDSLKETMITLPQDNAIGVRKKGKSVDKSRLVLGGKVSPSTWLACSTRATNNYGHKTRVIHAYNRYPPMEVEGYISSWKESANIGGVARNQFALAEMVQWIYRSAIRNGEEINLFILSERMENLFKEWLKCGSEVAQ